MKWSMLALLNSHYKLFTFIICTTKDQSQKIQIIHDTVHTLINEQIKPSQYVSLNDNIGKITVCRTKQGTSSYTVAVNGLLTRYRCHQ